MQNRLKIGSFLLSSTFLLGGEVVVSHDDDYYKYKDKKNDVEIIYTKNNLPFAKHTANLESHIHKDYKQIFDWKLDETLYVGLISSHNQIANGFSTQWPNNRQINYIGGTELVDEFSSISWLDTLLYHETAHNYQLNIKNNFVSKTLHTIFKNGSFLFPLYMSVPNIMENSFLLEGNAVLNESWHGNGGRLYSGINKAETILQAKAGKIKDSYVYNSRLAFPYGDIAYIQGGFYQLYLAQRFGLKKVNSYFKYHSEDFWFPVRTNASMKDAIGINFTQSLNDFTNYYKKLGTYFVKAQGKHLLSSQFFNSLSNSEDEIFFMINENGVSAPQLIVIDKKTQVITKKKRHSLSGKIIKSDENYYTQGGLHTSPTQINQALFDKDNYVKEGTKSKMVQGYLSDGKMVYFDVKSSFSQPQLYIEGKFYAQVNSSVIIDKDDNLYYFVQKGKTRTLYKNRTPLYSYKGFYGIVSDVDSRGKVYFIANSKLGSTLYAFKNGRIQRVTKADNIKEARLINDNEILLSAISDEDYYYVINKIENIRQKPFETKLFFENKQYYSSNKNTHSTLSKLDLSQDYSSFLDMHYSGSNATLGYGSYVGWIGSLNIDFGDPLSQNSATTFINKDSSGVTLAGLQYTNTQYRLEYSLASYKLLKHKENISEDSVRDYGLIANAILPLYQSGNNRANISFSYYQDYTTNSRKPLTLSLTLQNTTQYGNSMYINTLNKLKFYNVYERGDNIFGAKYQFKYDLPYQFYFGFDSKFSITDGDGKSASHSGVKLSNVTLSNFDETETDPSTIIMPNLSASGYTKGIGYAEINLAKVFNISAYFFTFPISLQRESIYTKYRRYSLRTFKANNYTINEITVGATFSTIFLNSFTIPLSMEYIYNDLTIEDEKFQFVMGTSF